MLSWSSYGAAGPGGRRRRVSKVSASRTFFAKVREALRGRRRTTSNSLKDLENLSMTPVCANSLFFLLVGGHA